MAKHTLGSITRHPTTVWIVAGGVVCVGLYLTHIQYLGIEWLSRAGCCVVMLGLWSGLGGIVQERILSRRLWRRHRYTVMRTRAALENDGIEPVEIQRQIDEIHLGFERKGTELAEKLKLNVGLLEISLLLTGTFLWGFGDLLLR